jgi:hypothetical protein
MTFAGFIGDRTAVAAGATIADVFPFQTDLLYLFAAGAFIGIGLAALRISGISCHFGREPSHPDALRIADKSRLCKLRTSILADFSKLRLSRDRRFK